MGLITSVFGGVLRDIVCNEIPRAFRDHRPNAIFAFFGCWMLFVAPWLCASDVMALIAAITLRRGIALISVYQLPA
jgi:uncharacterized membrane protein YeiH